MYTLLLALAISLVPFPLALLAGMSWVTGIVPALLIFPVVAFLLVRRTGQKVQAELGPVTASLQGLREAKSQAEVRAVVERAREGLERVRTDWSRWQVLLDRQIDGQVGMLDYMIMEFDAALPRLERAFRDWTAALAAACVHDRRGRTAERDAALANAIAYASKEPQIYLVGAVLQARKGDREAALRTVAQGLEALPDHGALKQLRAALANKEKVDGPTVLGEGWYGFFPEEAAQQAMVRGRRGPPPEGVTMRMQQGPPAPRMRGKLARRR